MARASTFTLLPIDDWARHLGVNPAHFAGAYNAEINPGTATCGDLWTQWNWQTRTDRASREDVALAIAGAEEDIARVAGFWPAPRWIAEEVHPYPRFHRPDLIQIGGLDARGYAKNIRADYGKIIAPGQRAVTLLGTPTTAGGTLVYADADGDGVVDTATVTQATTLTDACEVKVYFQGEAGAPEWEIRPARTAAIAGGIFTATFWAWQLIDPVLWEALPGVTEPEGIDYDEQTVPGTYDNLVASVDVYREFNDTTETSATFYWEPETAALNWLNLVCSCGGSGTCAACALTTQDGCLHVRDANQGLVAPWPADYDGGAWEGAAWSACRDPDFVKLWYYTGDISQRRLGGRTCQPLSEYWAQTITWLSVARLEKPLCSCDNVADLVANLRADMSLVGGPTSYNATIEQLNCPWGTRRGAVMAWERVSKLVKKRARVAVV